MCTNSRAFKLAAHHLFSIFHAVQRRVAAGAGQAIGLECGVRPRLGVMATVTVSCRMLGVQGSRRDVLEVRLVDSDPQSGSVPVVQIRLQEPEGRIGSDRQRVKKCNSSCHGRLYDFS